MNLNQLSLVATLFLTGLHSLQAQFVVFGAMRPSNQTPTGFSLDYGTNTSGTAVVRYGQTTSYELGTQVGSSPAGLTHNVSLSGLQAAEFYYVRPGIFNGTDTVWGNPGFFSTASTSSGRLRVFFNKGVFTPIADPSNLPEITNSGNLILDELIKYIDSAQTSIDIAVYNNDRSTITAALNRAHNRGVRVRYIANDGTSNTALSASNNPAFPRISVNPNAFMHNKFMIVDAENADRAWVWTGSMNWTSNNFTGDANNVIVIQDQALAKAFRLEFEEMWGSDGAAANLSLSRVSSAKISNTPQVFNVGGQRMELYFSPSDQTNSRILGALQSADNSLYFNLLTLTRNDLGTAIIAAHQRGVDVKGIIQNTGDQGSRYQPMRDSGVDVRAETSGTGVHHKYGVVDANSDSDPVVITGSHNWSTSAETVNDENTLLIYGRSVANLFVQEFARRWCDILGGSCNFSVPTALEHYPTNPLPQIKLFPNPVQAGQVQHLVFDQALTSPALLRCYNAQGQELWQESLPVGTQNLELKQGQNLPQGLYFWSLEQRGQAEVLPWVKQ